MLPPRHHVENAGQLHGEEPAVVNVGKVFFWPEEVDRPDVDVEGPWGAYHCRLVQMLKMACQAHILLHPEDAVVHHRHILARAQDVLVAQPQEFFLTHLADKEQAEVFCVKGSISDPSKLLYREHNPSMYCSAKIIRGVRIF